MGIVIRPANLEADRVLLIESIRRYLAPQANERRFDWLYRNGPNGPAQAWIASQGKEGPLIGAAAAFPRRMYVGGALRKGCVLGDFFIVPEFRSLGPAVQLQRACLASVDSKTFDLAYDFPAAAMVPIYRRLAVEPAADKLIRMAKPLRADRKIRESVGNPLLAGGLSSVANQVLKLKDRRAGKDNTLEITVHEGLCGEEFTSLSSAAKAHEDVFVERSAEYLNWRFKNHFARRYEFLIARRDAKLLAYLVYAVEGEDAEISDLFGSHDESVLTNLLVDLVARLRERNVVTLNAPVLASHRSAGTLLQLGFREREACPVIQYFAPQAGKATSRSWFLMQGDRES